VARWQLLAIGIAADTVDDMVERRELLPELWGVYAVGHRAPAPLTRETAALLAVPRAVALSHRSAALLWRLQGIPQDPGNGIDVVVRGTSCTRIAVVRAHRSRRLTPRDVRVTNGLPATSPAWTLIDLAGERDPAIALDLAFDDALIRGLVRENELRALIKRSPGRAGVGAVRALLDAEQRPVMTRSRGERRLRALLREARLPAPQSNAVVHGWEVDFFWPEHRLVVELDGFDFHRTRRTIDRDRRKDQALRAHGLPPLRVTGMQLAHESLAVVAAIALGLTTGG
jgi:very-short-patch-repair endonuclease